MEYDVYADIIAMTEDGCVELVKHELAFLAPISVDGLLGKIPMLDLALVRLEDIHEEDRDFSRVVSLKNLTDAVFMIYCKKADGEGEFLSHIFTNFVFCPTGR